MPTVRPFCKTIFDQFDPTQFRNVFMYLCRTGTKCDTHDAFCDILNPKGNAAVKFVLNVFSSWRLIVHCPLSIVVLVPFD
jgi:hypothetical protein